MEEVNQNQTIQEQVSAEQFKPKSSFPKSILILVIVLVLGIIGGAYYLGVNRSQPKICSQELKQCPDGAYVPRSGPSCEFTPCPPFQPKPTIDLTSEWKTYTNEKYSFSINYPSNWFIKDMRKVYDGSNILDAQSLNDTKNIDINNYKVNIILDNADIEKSKKYLNFGDAGMQNKAEIETDTIDGKEIIRAIVTFSQLDPKTNQYVDEGKIYKVLIPLGNYTLNINSKLEEKKIVDQILSTFKFLEQDQKINNSSWKTYINKQLGFSIKYPQNLYIKESDSVISFTFEPYPTGEGMGPLDLIEIGIKGRWVAFDDLYKANQGDDVPAAHGGVYVEITKLRNLKFGNYNAVEYIRDGITPPRGDLGRGPTGYEHHFLIKKNEEEFIDVVNQSMEVEKTKQRDSIFNKMISSLIVE